MATFVHVVIAPRNHEELSSCWPMREIAERCRRMARALTQHPESTWRRQTSFLLLPASCETTWRCSCSLAFMLPVGRRANPQAAKPGSATAAAVPALNWRMMRRENSSLLQELGIESARKLDSAPGRNGSTPTACKGGRIAVAPFVTLSA